MPVPVKNPLSDFKKGYEPSCKNDFRYYWNGGIAETIAYAIAEEPDTLKDEPDIVVHTVPHSISNIKNLFT